MTTRKNTLKSVKDMDLDEANRMAVNDSQADWVTRYYVALDFRLPNGCRLIGAPLTVGYGARSFAEAELDRLKPAYQYAYIAHVSMDPDYSTPDGENIFQCELYRGGGERSIEHVLEARGAA